MSRDPGIRHTAAQALGLLALAFAGTAVGAAGASAAAPAPTAGAAGGGEPPCARVAPFSPQRFTNPTTVSNAWHPLVPGAQWVMEGTADRGGGADSAHRVVFTVTDLTKVIGGVRTVVVWDVDENEGQIVESELAFFAQDDAGNVWKLGEYPEEYEEGRFVTAASAWIAGVQNAEPGVQMVARPQDWTTTSYLQGWAPASDFLDCAKTYRSGREVCVPAGCYADVLVMRERSPLDAGNAQQGKYYAPGAGNVKIDAVNDPEGETLELVGLIRLSPGALDEAVAEALKLDERGYLNSPAYQGTPRAERVAAVAEAPAPAPAAPQPPPPLTRARLRARLPRPSRPPVTIRRVGRSVVATVDGALELPPPVSRRQGCRGFVLVTVRRGRSVVVRRAMRLGRNCRFRRQFRVAGSELRGRRAVTVAVRFRGNRTLRSVERLYPIRIRTR